MDLLHIVLLGVIVFTGHQLFVAFTQGRIFGRNRWFSYGTGWISTKHQSNIFYVTLATYSVGFIGAIIVLALYVLS